MSGLNYQGQGAPRAAYELHRSDADEAGKLRHSPGTGEYDDANSSIADHSTSEAAYLDIYTASAGDHSTVVTAAHILNNNNGDPENADATEQVHEMHLALLYLLSNPEEFQRAVQHHDVMASTTTTLAQWNAEYGDNESLYTDADSVQHSPERANHSSNATTTATAASTGSSTPLPYAVFADDAEVVLPQAHTASQLFGLETVTGMELEAAAGVPALSQLFLRWLALMPSGDHLNLIDPPGLTVMRIAGGRYRVTAAHRVVWTWMNEFAPVQSSADTEAAPGGVHTLQIGDLVSMTIVDVFESDNQGKLLSYCPTFDNRAVTKTDRTAHAIRKQAGALKSAFRTAQNSKLALAVAKYTGSLAQKLWQRVDDAVHNYSHQGGSPPRNQEPSNTDHTESSQITPKRTASKLQSAAGTSVYMADDDMERHEV